VWIESGGSECRVGVGSSRAKARPTGGDARRSTDTHASGADRKDEFTTEGITGLGSRAVILAKFPAFHECLLRLPVWVPVAFFGSGFVVLNIPRLAYFSPVNRGAGMGNMVEPSLGRGIRVCFREQVR
jgi:hypothetical protein